MRIVEFCVGRARTDSSNGVELSVFRLSETLAVENAVLTVCLSEKPIVEVPGVRVINLPPAGKLFPISGGLLDSVIDWRPDVVHMHSVYTPANVHLARMLRRERIPYIVTPHGGYGRANEQHRRLVKSVYRFMFERSMLDGAEFIHSVGDASDIREVAPRVEIVETTKGLDAPGRSFSNPIPRSGENPGGMKFGYVGRLDPLHKGLDLLIEAFAHPDLAECLLILVGPSHERGRSTLEKQASAIGVADRVIFTGPLVGEAKESKVFEMDVFAHVSRWEGGIPYAVLEAAASARPLMLTHAADPHGALVHVGAGVGVEPTVDAVSEAMVALKSLPTAALRDMGEKGKRFVMENFSWERMGTQLIEALSEKGIGQG